MKSKILAIAVVGALSLCAAESPRILAHRGNYQYDDNALGGFEQSLAAGVTGFELDVQMTSDGEFVLMHNDTVDGTTDGTGNVKDLTLAQVTALKLKKSGENVPTLQQLADLFKNRSDVYIEFEMKSQGFTGNALNNYVDGVYQIVSSTLPAGATYVFTSFSQAYLSAMKTRHPESRIGLIVSGTQTDNSKITEATNLGCFSIAPGVGTDKEWVQAAQAAGLKVTLWMVEDIATWQACRAKGADSTTSNHPISLLPEVKQSLAIEEQGTAWAGQRYFTNDAPWTISSVLSGAEGLGKWGSGDLTISGKNTFTGDVLLAGGNTILTLGNDVKDVQYGALGHPRVERTIMVTNGAALTIKGANAIAGGGTSTTPPLAALHVVDATLNFQTNFSCNLGDVYFHNANITYNGGYPYNWRHWGTLLCRNLYFSGTKTYSFPLNGQYVSNSNRDQNNCGLLIGKWAPSNMGEIRVPDMSGNSNVDVDFGWVLFQCINSDGCIGSFRKTGDGTLQLSCSVNNFAGNIRVEEGTLKLSKGQATLNATRSALGNTQIVHTNYVGPGATLWHAASDLQGQMYNQSKIVTHIDGGTLRQNDNLSNAMGPVILENATLNYAGHPSSTYKAGKKVDGKWPQNPDWTVTSHWGTFAFNGGLWVKGTNTLTLANKKSGNTQSILCFTGDTMKDVRVDDISKNANSDLTIQMPINDGNVWAAYDNYWITGTNHAAQASSFRKTGAGTLEFNGEAIYSEYSGDVEVAEGVLRFSGGWSDWNRYYSRFSHFGDTEKPHTITVLGGGELNLANADLMGQLAKLCPGPMLVVSNGTLRINDACCNGLPKMRFFNGKFIYGTGSVGARHWGICGLNSLVEFDGDNGAMHNWPDVSVNNWINLGYAGGMSVVTNSNNTVLFTGYTEMRVHDVTRDANVDVTISPILQDVPDWDTRNQQDTVIGKKPTYYRCGLRKTGAGTLRLTNNNVYTGATEVVEGALLVDSPSSKSAVTVKSGAKLGGAGVVPSVTLEEGAGFTAAPGQTGSLTIQSLTLPANNEVAIDVMYAGDVTEVAMYSVPVVKTTGLENVKWNLTYNGGQAPNNYRLGTTVKNGVLHAQIARSGLTVTVR